MIRAERLGFLLSVVVRSSGLRRKSKSALPTFFSGHCQPDPKLLNAVEHHNTQV